MTTPHPSPTDLAVLLVSAALSDNRDALDSVQAAAIADFVQPAPSSAPELEGNPGEPFMQWLADVVEYQQDVHVRLAQVVGTLVGMTSAALSELESETGRPAFAWVEQWRAAQD